MPHAQGAGRSTEPREQGQEEAPAPGDSAAEAGLRVTPARRVQVCGVAELHQVGEPHRPFPVGALGCSPISGSQAQCWCGASTLPSPSRSLRAGSGSASPWHSRFPHTPWGAGPQPSAGGAVPGARHPGEQHDRLTCVHTHSLWHVCPHVPWHTCPLMCPFPTQNKVRELEERCRAQSEQFSLLSRDLEKFRQQAGRVDLLGSPTAPRKPFPFMNGLAASLGTGGCWWWEAAAPSMGQTRVVGQRGLGALQEVTRVSQESVRWACCWGSQHAIAASWEGDPQLP